MPICLPRLRPSQSLTTSRDPLTGSRLIPPRISRPAPRPPLPSGGSKQRNACRIPADPLLRAEVHLTLVYFACRLASMKAKRKWRQCDIEKAQVIPPHVIRSEYLWVCKPHLVYCREVCLFQFIFILFCCSYLVEKIQIVVLTFVSKKQRKWQCNKSLSLRFMSVVYLSVPFPTHLSIGNTVSELPIKFHITYL